MFSQDARREQAWRGAVSRTLVLLWWGGVVTAAALTWAQRHDAIRAWIGWLEVVVLAIESAWLSTRAVRHPRSLAAATAVGVPVLTGAACLAAHGFVYGGDQTFRLLPPASLWSLTAVVAAGASRGSWWGAAAGAATAVARLAGLSAPGRGGHGLSSFVRLSPPGVAVVVAASVLALVIAATTAARLTGWLAGAETDVARTEERLATARAREEYARHLHDSVLQTFAVIRRRVSDQTVNALVDEADDELRRFLEGSRRGVDGLAAAVHSEVRRFERRFGLTATTAVSSELPPCHPRTVDAISGALAEALTNVGRHAGAAQVHVYVAGDGGDGVMAGVRDDGRGFDPPAAIASGGLRHSVIEPVRTAGGRVEIRSEPGAGTEVTVWVP